MTGLPLNALLYRLADGTEGAALTITGLDGTPVSVVTSMASGQAPEAAMAVATFTGGVAGAASVAVDTPIGLMAGDWIVLAVYGGGTAAVSAGFTAASAPPPPAALTVITTSLPAATAGALYSAVLAATGGTGTVTWAATGLPAGLTVTTAGAIGGTPAAAGAATVAVTASDAAGGTATASLPLTVNAALPAPVLPSGPPGSWALAFEDRFGGTALNPANWTALDAPSVGGSPMSPANVSVSGGYCHVRLGGTISSNPSNDGFGPGAAGPLLAVGDCVEASVSFPGPSGTIAYNTPAFWVSGAAWPANGEQDIFSAPAGVPLALGYHSPSGPSPGPAPAGSWCNAFHTYTCVRGAATIEVYWDGQLIRSVGRADAGGPQTIMITAAPGNTPSATAEILVKYVRLWKPA